jgi:hypothetical protein
MKNEIAEIVEGSFICVMRNKLFDFNIINEVISIDKKSGIAKLDNEAEINISDKENYKIISDNEIIKTLQIQRQKITSGIEKLSKKINDIFQSDNFADNNACGIIAEIKASKVSLYDYSITLKVITNKDKYNVEKTTTARVSNAEKSVLEKIKTLSAEKRAELLALIS